MELWLFVSFHVGMTEWIDFGIASESRNMVAEMLQLCVNNNGTNFVVRGRYI